MSKKMLIALTVFGWTMFGLGFWAHIQTSAPAQLAYQHYEPVPIIVYPTPTQPATEYNYYDIPLSIELQDFVIELCKDKPFTPELVYGIIFTESRFIPTAINQPTKCYGLMQVMQPYFLHWNPDGTDILDPKDNITAGVNALYAWSVICQEKGFVSIYDYLEAYNKGYTHFSMPAPTYDYAARVMSYIETKPFS